MRAGLSLINRTARLDMWPAELTLNKGTMIPLNFQELQARLKALGTPVVMIHHLLPIAGNPSIPMSNDRVYMGLWNMLHTNNRVRVDYFILSASLFTDDPFAGLCDSYPVPRGCSWVWHTPFSGSCESTTPT